MNIPKYLRKYSKQESQYSRRHTKVQKTLQYARSKVDYMISEFIHMLPCDMNLQIGKVKNYNNKILISSPSFKIGTNVKINLDGEKDKPDVKPKDEGIVKTKPDVKQKRNLMSSPI